MAPLRKLPQENIWDTYEKSGGQFQGVIDQEYVVPNNTDANIDNFGAGGEARGALEGSNLFFLVVAFIAVISITVCILMSLWSRNV